jgi:hypothetical protein
MKKLLFIWVLMVLKIAAINAQNLISNPGFELIDSCPTALGQLAYCTSWKSPTLFAPDLWHRCLGPSCPPLFKAGGFQYAHNGIGQIGASNIAFFYNNLHTGGFNLRKYFQQHLLDTLIIGHRYRFSMFINAGNSSISSVEFKLGINNDGVLFTTWPISNDSLPSLGPPVYAPNFIYKPQKPQINFTQVITDTLNWTELTQDFVADSAYQYITIGNFYSDAQTTVYTIDDTTSILGAQTEAYQLFDDISLYDLGVDGLQGIKQAAILISPNPCSDLLKVNYSTEIKVVSMYSIIGNCVYSQLVNNNQTTIDTHLLPTGIYTLKCETTNAVITKKIIVQQ